MDISKVKQQWKRYNIEFENSNYMDVDKHTSMALKVGSLIKEIDKLNTGLDKIRFLKHSFVGDRTDLHKEIERVINGIR
ncbi:hypothetical protein [Priestia aryabhattai]